MIKTFSDKHTHDFYITGKFKRLPADLLKRAMRRLHDLKDDRDGQHSISINDQWRIYFRFKDGDAYDVEITDYH